MVRKIGTILFASTLIGVGINGFIIPIHLINGGLWGVSLILHYLLGFKIALTFAFLNLPVFLFAGMYDRDYFVNGVIGIMISSSVVALLSPIQHMMHLSTLSSAVLGGAAIGLGVGLLLRQRISPGGIDLLALMISKMFSINVGISLLIMDSAIILSGAFILRDERLLYSMLIVLIVGFTAIMLTSIKSVKVFDSLKD
ncbi:YitT family protein [Sporolactobacillus putidus]|uniref:YitT family protein n=1 Tax=Sporolactobacillus putidus TaxID=492735 RepID=A0A917RZX2_9BACL|nr:YitT family protein [Sporolactobacillus putidus]GGL47755.1 hypothetical protein GCM10007968_09870 [Sporolactobacillus putidus]